MKGEGFVLNTFAHELTHHIRDWSPTKFKALADFLVKEYGKAGQSVDELVHARMARSNLNYDAAFEEVVADSMEKMFADGNIMDKLAKLKAQDKGLLQRIKNFIDKWLSKIKEFYSAEGQYVTREGELAHQLEKFEQLQQLFVEALADAGENYLATKKGTNGRETVLDNGQNNRYSKRENSARFFPGNVFPSGLTHTSVAEWAMRKDVKTGDKRLVNYRGAFYRVEKFDDMDFGYLITKKYDAQSYNEELREYGEIDSEESVQKRIDRVDALYRETDEYGHGRHHAGSSGTEYRGENIPLLSVGQDTTEGRGYSGRAERDRKGSLRDQRHTGRESLEWTPEELYDKMQDLDHKLVYATGRYATALRNKRERYASMIDDMNGWDSVKLSDRDTESISNRSILANAFESMAQNDIERQKIAEYKSKIETKEAEERKLRDLKEQIKDMSFAKGPRDTAKLRSLREEAIKTANRLSIYGGQLLHLEASVSSLAFNIFYR